MVVFSDRSTSFPDGGSWLFHLFQPLVLIPYSPCDSPGDFAKRQPFGMSSLGRGLRGWDAALRDAPRAHPGCSSRKRAQRSKAQDSGAFLCDFPPGPLICIVPATCLIFGVRPPKRRYCLPSASGAPEKVFVGSEVLSLRPGLFCMPYTPLSDE